MSIRKFLGGVGDLAKKAAPFAAFIPTIGPLAAAGIGAAGGALGTLNDEEGTDLGRALKHGLGHGAAAGISGYGIERAGGAGGIGRAIMNELGPSSAGLPTAFAPAMASPEPPVPPAPTSGPASGGGMSTLEKAALLSTVLGGASSIYGAHQAGRFEDEERRRRERRARSVLPLYERLLNSARF